MIKVKNGEATLTGTPVDLCADLTMAIKAVVHAFEENELDIELVKKSVELGFKSEDELRKEVEAKMGKLIMNMINSILEDEEEESEDE